MGWISLESTIIQAIMSRIVCSLRVNKEQEPQRLKGYGHKVTKRTASLLENLYVTNPFACWNVITGWPIGYHFPQRFTAIICHCLLWTSICLSSLIKWYKSFGKDSWIQTWSGVVLGNKTLKTCGCLKRTILNCLHDPVGWSWYTCLG